MELSELAHADYKTSWSIAKMFYQITVIARNTHNDGLYWGVIETINKISGFNYLLAEMYWQLRSNK